MTERVRAVPRPRTHRDLSPEEQAIIKKRHDKRWAQHERIRRAQQREDDLEEIEYGGGRDRYEIRLFPDYDEEGGFPASEKRCHLCRFLVPWCLARALNQMGLDFTISIDRTAMRTRAAKRCRWIFLVILLTVGLLGASYVAWCRGSELQEILHSPCYVCRRNRAHFISYSSSPYKDKDIDMDATPWWQRRPRAGLQHLNEREDDEEDEENDETEEARRALSRYARYAHGEPCALSDTWVAAIDQELTGRWLNHTIRLHATTDSGIRRRAKNPWLRYDRLWSGATALSMMMMWHQDTTTQGKGKGKGKGKSFKKESEMELEEDWRNALPRLWVVGARGAGTTSFAQYLGAHPGIDVRRSTPAVGDGVVAPWDDHFFAMVPHWAADEVRGWLRRGWGPPTLRDHQGRGKLRVEVGPDYLWHTATGAAGAVRRATSKRPGLFVVLLADPVRLAQEAFERARASGSEERESFADVVAEELPALARCLWWDGASPAEQRERVISGHCGGAEPGRVGPPYLWRGLLSEFLAHWMRTATPGPNARRHWYFVRATDLLHQPNRTLNRLVQGYLGLPAFDFGPHVSRAWHPAVPVVQRVAPETPWTQSWRSFVPRVEYLRHIKKTVADGLLEGAERAAKKVVPGLEAGLAARDKLHRLHCRLAGYVDTKLLSTERCLRPEPSSLTQEDDGGKNRKRRRRRKGRKSTKRGQDDAEGEGDGEEGKDPENVEANKIDAAQEREEQALAALRDFYTPFQSQLMELIDAVDDLRARFPLTWAEQVQHLPPQTETEIGNETESQIEIESETGNEDRDGKGDDRYEEELRKMYLGHFSSPPPSPLTR